MRLKKRLKGGPNDSGRGETNDLSNKRLKKRRYQCTKDHLILLKPLNVLRVGSSRRGKNRGKDRGGAINKVIKTLSPKVGSHLCTLEKVVLVHELYHNKVRQRRDNSGGVRGTVWVKRWVTNIGDRFCHDKAKKDKRRGAENDDGHRGSDTILDL